MDHGRSPDDKLDDLIPLHRSIRMEELVMIKKAKLNTCAHCQSKENLHMVFDADKKMYFICSTHKILLDSLIESTARLGVRL